MEEKMESRTYHFKLETVSPIHIGCGEAYDPTSFAVDEHEKKLIAFNTVSFLSQLDENALKRFSSICEKGTESSLVDIYKFIKSHRGNAKGRKVEITDDFINHYTKVLENRQPLNKFEIGRTAFHTLYGTPYIPGSAIKGAIRTAVLNLRNNGKTTPPFRGKNAGQELQEHLLDYNSSQMATDPFRLIKVSDFHAAGTQISQRIIYSINKKKKSAKDAKGISQLLEIITPRSLFTGTITVYTADKGTKINRPVTFEELHRALVFFYGDEQRKESRILDNIGCAFTGFKHLAPDIPLVRIGRHSGAECVTVNGHRRIKIMKNGFKPQTTTIWLAANSKKPSTLKHAAPFGWASLTILSEKEAEELEKQKLEKFNHWETKLEKELVIQRQKKLELEKERKEKEEKKREKEEIERLYPWRKYLAPLSAISDWGALKTHVLENQDLLQYQNEKEVGHAAEKAARQVAENHPEKWNRERDTIVKTWLEPSGITWIDRSKPDKNSAENELIGKIRNFSGPGDYDRSLDISSLDKECCGLLVAHFKKWNWHNRKRARKTNHQLWLALKKRRNELKS